jgi:hypothetical protein
MLNGQKGLSENIPKHARLKKQAESFYLSHTFSNAKFKNSQHGLSNVDIILILFTKKK